MEPCLWTFGALLCFITAWIILLRYLPPASVTLDLLRKHFSGWQFFLVTLAYLFLSRQGSFFGVVTISVAAFGCLGAICSGLDWPTITKFLLDIFKMVERHIP